MNWKVEIVKMVKRKEVAEEEGGEEENYPRKVK